MSQNQGLIYFSCYVNNALYLLYIRMVGLENAIWSLSNWFLMAVVATDGGNSPTSDQTLWLIYKLLTITVYFTSPWYTFVCQTVFSTLRDWFVLYHTIPTISPPNYSWIHSPCVKKKIFSIILVETFSYSELFNTDKF